MESILNEVTYKCNIAQIIQAQSTRWRQRDIQEGIKYQSLNQFAI